MNLKIFITLLLVIFLLSSCCNIEPDSKTPSPPSPVFLKMHFIDVGQGDSILVETPGGKNMLIDAGDNSEGERVVSYIEKEGIKRLDVIVATHPDSDHIGGMDNVVESFDVGKIYMPDKTKTTKTFKDVLVSIRDKGLKITKARAGVNIDLDPSINVEILSPNSAEYEETNNYSIVIKLVYDNTSFLLPGDAEGFSEKEMIKKGYDLKSDVLKLGHHGSHSSTTPDFLEKVSPKYAIICAGKGNKFGHPHKETLKKLKKAGIQLYRTDKNGTIIAISDGKRIEFNLEREDN
ncbi:MAG TPA: ComEC/Rec2 family competence protein [Candidatus Eremiobacteraeota bacterium]|nr:MAG: ComEC family competence protein [bacterium ADurb.Bin363]HPZ09965.1 ComEC/Rec2 family competence protein [Candidatus Eremiobacteraeota bacterium]